MTAIFKGRDNPFGADILPDPTKCAAGLFSNHVSHQCSRKGKVEEDGHVWCKTHLPSAVQAKKDAERAKWEKSREARNLARTKQVADGVITKTARLYFKQEASHDDLEKAVSEREKLDE